MKAIFNGVATALVTPFNHNEVDYACLEKLIERQIQMGVDALVVLGTTGEISTLTDTERKKIIDTTLAVNHGRVPLIFGIGGNDPKRIIDLGEYVAKQTAELPERYGIMITAPYYNKGTQASVYNYFRLITNKLKLPTIIYNVPNRTGINLLPNTLAKIARLRYVAGIKEASGEIGQIIQTVKLCPHTAVYCGDDTIALPSYAVGCRGIISVASNLDVAPVKQIYQLQRNGQPHEALKLFQAQVDGYQSLFRAVNPIPIKYELAKLGLIKNALRLPLAPLK